MASFERMQAVFKARKLFAHPRKLFALFRHPETPLLAKMLPIIAVVYFLFPLDILPDFIPLIGQMDDLTVAVTIIYFALRLVPKKVFDAVGLNSFEE